MYVYQIQIYHLNFDGDNPEYEQVWEGYDHLLFERRIAASLDPYRWRVYKKWKDAVAARHEIAQLICRHFNDSGYSVAVGEESENIDLDICVSIGLREEEYRIRIRPLEVS